MYAWQPGGFPTPPTIRSVPSVPLMRERSSPPGHRPHLRGDAARRAGPPGPWSSPRPRVGAARKKERSRNPRRPTHGEDAVILYGWHTVKAALENPARRFRRLLATENAARRLAGDGILLPLTPEVVRPDVIAGRLSPDAVH